MSKRLAEHHRATASPPACGDGHWQLTSCTLRELAAVFGRGHPPDSIRDLTRRVDRALPVPSTLRRGIAAIRQELLQTERI